MPVTGLRGRQVLDGDITRADINTSTSGSALITKIIAGTNITAGTVITALGSGTGGAGTYTISPASTGTVSGTITIVGAEFRNIPSGVERITVMFNGFSTSGTSNIIVQLGAGSIEATSYSGSATSTSGTAATSSSLLNSTGFLLAFDTSNTVVRSGIMTIVLLASNTWVSATTIARTDAAGSSYGAGSKTLSGTLDRVRVTTVNGTDTFDAGSINILFE